MANKSMLELAQLASEVAKRVVAGDNIEHEIVKVAAREDLDAAEIRTLTQRVNKGVIVPMHQKVAAKRLPLGATFKTASADNVIEVVDRLQDAPKPAEPTLPPRRDGFKEAEIQKHIADHFGGESSPQTRPLRIKAEVYANSPELVETISSVETATRVVEHLADRLEKARETLAEREVEAHNLLQDARKVASSLLQQDTPPQIIRQAASDCPELVLAITSDMRRGHVKEAALPPRYVIDSSHPFVKLAREARDAVAAHAAQRAEVDRLATMHQDVLLKRAEIMRHKKRSGLQ